MNKYTVIAEFRGGTYVSQVESDSVRNSINPWLKQFKKDRKEIQYLGEKTLLELVEEIKNFDPAPLSGLINAWYTMLSTKQGPISMNIVKTDLS